MQERIVNSLIYKLRYPIGYALIGMLIVAVIAIAAIASPNALRQAEMTSTIASAGLSTTHFTPAMVVDLPYHVLQRLVMTTLGVSTLTIKLPSIVLGALTVIGVYFLIRIWFKRNIAVISTVIAASSTLFLFAVQDGTPAITFSFIAIWLLLSGTCVTRNFMFGTFWKVVTGVLLAAALYIPLGIYLVAAVLTTAFLHPHIRYTLRHVERKRLILAISFAVLVLVPLVYACIIDNDVLLSLLGTNPDDFSLGKNLMIAATYFFGFAHSPDSYLLQPVFSLAHALLIALGFFNLWKQRHTARSYVTLIISVILIPFFIIDPTHVTTAFAVGAILSAYGMSYLISSWYSLFPRNPYARVAGLIPLGVLTIGMVYSGLARHIYNYTYNPEVVRNFSVDLRLLQNTLSSRSKDTPITVVATEYELDFLRVVAHYDDRFKTSDTELPGTPVFVMTKDAHAKSRPANAILEEIVTSSRATSSDRFYIYKSTAK